MRVVGALGARPEAALLAAEVRRVHERYVGEVVVPYGLCPHLTHAESAFGAFCVVVDREIDVDVARGAVIDSRSSIVHVVFPCAHGPSNDFERFGSRLDESLAGATAERLVHATFHPLLAGGTEDAHRLIGLLRRAPDPFVQLIPSGLAHGGTTYGQAAPGKSHAERTFERLVGAKGAARSRGLDELLERLADIRADRDRSYAPHVGALYPPA